jgi:hypothetical protein
MVVAGQFDFQCWGATAQVMQQNGSRKHVSFASLMEQEGNYIGQLIIMVGFWGGVLAYPILQFFAVKRMRGVWRGLAVLPIVLMGFVFAITVIGVLQESNLWPIVLIFAAPVVLLYLAVLMVLHALVKRGKNGPSEQT